MVFSFFLSVGLFGLSFLLWWFGKRQTLKSLTAGATPELPIKQLFEDSAAVSAELGSGAFRQAVKIHGVVSCDAPLLAELTQTPCVAYRFTVSREYDEAVRSTDDKGNITTTRVRKSEVVASNERRVAFWLDDGTGRILVQPEKAKVDLEKTLSSFEISPQTAFAHFHLVPLRTGGDTLGYRYEESCLPLGREVSVYAEATDLGGALELAHPETKGNLHVISLRSLQDVAKSVKTTASVLFGTSIGAAVLAAGVLLLGVIR